MVVDGSKFHRVIWGTLICLGGCSDAESLTALSPDTTGEIPSTSTIVGGDPAGLLNEYPFMVSLRTQNNFHFCGGTLLNDRTVLTAAHCIDSDGPDGINPASEPEDIFVAVGRYLRLSAAPQNVAVVDIVSHPDFVGDTGFPFNYDSDVALLELAQPQPSVPKVTLINNESLIVAGTTSTAVGWGILRERGLFSPIRLQEVDVPVVDNAECRALYDQAGFRFTAESITANMVCAGFPQGGQDACQGDSGGPLLASQGGQLQQIGITSFGEGCARPNRPGVYTNVLNFVDWIEANAF